MEEFDGERLVLVSTHDVVLGALRKACIKRLELVTSEEYSNFRTLFPPIVQMNERQLRSAHALLGRTLVAHMAKRG